MIPVQCQVDPEKRAEFMPLNRQWWDLCQSVAAVRRKYDFVYAIKRCSQPVTIGTKPGGAASEIGTRRSAVTPLKPLKK
jgi:hypothetical protein